MTRELVHSHAGSPTQGTIGNPVTIVVVGMHRTGTSALCGTLQALGIPFPGELLGGASDNAKGFFENLDVLRLQREFIAELGSSWDDPLPLPLSWSKSAALDRLAAKIQNSVFETFAGEPVFAVKEPQLCLLMPAWIAAAKLSGRRILSIHTYRDPLSVAQSLHARNGFPRAHGLMLWLKYVLASELATRDIPRCFVSYDALLSDWRLSARKIASDLQLAWPRDGLRAESEVDDFLEADLRHHLPQADASLPSGDQLLQLGTTALAALDLLARDPVDDAAKATLDRVNDEVRHAAALFGPILAGSERASAKTAAAHRARVAELDAEVDLRGKVIGDRDARLQAAATQTEALQAEVDLRGKVISERDARLEAAAAQMEALQAEVARLSADEVILRREIDTRGGAIEDRDRQLSSMSALTERLQQQLGEHTGLLAEQEALRSQSLSHIAALEGEVANLSSVVERERTERVAEAATQRSALEQAVQDRGRAVRGVTRDAASHQKAALAARAANRVLREQLSEERLARTVEIASLTWRHTLDHRRSRAVSAGLHTELQDLKTALRGAGQTMRDLQGELDAERAALADILGSRAWAFGRAFRFLDRHQAPRGGERLAQAMSGSPADPASTPPQPSDPTLDAASPELLTEHDSAASEARPPELSAAEPSDFPLPGYVAAMSELTSSSPRQLDVVVSVVIPTYNAGSEFFWLLKKLRAQQGLAPIEIVIVDSGSSDGTLGLAEQAGCVIIRSDKEDFSHSHTRNLGAEAARGELLLFMVQDAYPVGDLWLHALVEAYLHPRHESERMAALSCTEYPRADSELFYNTQIAIHYRFLQCEDADRVGRMVGNDSASLRVQGQLSDIACLISRDLFLQYRYQGRYAEDLLIGLQLVKDGHKAGLLSSLRVIHSHTRPCSYQVRRVFVDVLFLSEVFHDQFVPRASSVIGTAMGGYALQDVVKGWQPLDHGDVSEAVTALIGRATACKLPKRIPDLVGDGFGFAPLGSWIGDVAARSGRVGAPPDDEDVRDAEQVRQMLVDRLRDLQAHAARVYTGMDALIASDLFNAVEKSLAMSAGANLAFIYLNTVAAGQDAPIIELKPMLLEGI